MPRLLKIESGMTGTKRTVAVLEAAKHSYEDEMQSEQISRQKYIIRYLLPIITISAFIVGFIIGRGL